MKMIFSVFIGLFLLGSSATMADEQLNISPAQILNLGLEMGSVERVSSAWSRNFPAQVVIPNRQIRVLNAMLPGLVNVLYVAEGDQIKKGQPLAEISSPAFLKIQQDYLEALSAQAQMKRNYDRNVELLEEGIISEKTYLSGEAENLEAQASLYSSYQALLFSGLNEQKIETLRETREMQRSMVIPAPFDGVVLAQIVKTGEHVDEDVSLYHVGQLDPLWVEVHVPYSLRSTLQVGNSIIFENSDIKSKIITIGQMVHEDDQGIIVRGLMDAGQKTYIPGQFIKAQLEQKMEQGAFFRIPSGAVIRTSDAASVFVRNSSGFIMMDARIVADEGTSLVVEANLKEDDQIAAKGLVTLKGMLEGLGSEE